MPAWVKWLLGVAGGCVLVAVWLLTGHLSQGTRAERKYAEYRGWRGAGAEAEFIEHRRTIDRLQNEYDRASVALRRVAGLQEAERLLPDSAALIVHTADEVPARFGELIEQAARAEYAPAASPRVPVLLSFTPRTRAGDGLQNRLGDSQVDFLADRGGRFCAVVGAVGFRTTNDRFLRPVARQALGACRLWARYGAPGDGIEAWLAAGAMEFTRHPEELFPLPDSLRSRRAFGGRREWGTELALEPCLAGAARRCLAALLHPPGTGASAPAPAGVLATSMAYVWNLPEYASPHLLASLEAEFGPERFARFWSSSADIESAFREAFGLPLEVWAMRWLQAGYGRAPVGPRLAGSTLLLSMLTLGLLAAAAVAVGRRRALA